LAAINEVEEGKVKSYSSAKELMSELKKKADVQNKNNQQV
jgi:hypothetical protein